jgi:outer membrane lipoprotein LolB
MGRIVAWLLIALLTAGCATRERAAGPVDAAAGRRTFIESVTSWEARGRIALKAPGASGQGTFAWTQAGERTVLRVVGPFGAGGYEIRRDPAGLTVLSGKGEVAADYAGTDAAERFLAEQVGWSLPVDNARYWLRGLPGPVTPAGETLRDDGLIATLAQDGWAVAFDEYRAAGPVAMPRKLVLTGPGGRIRLVIDEWRF